jgi:hypothetical protein
MVHVESKFLEESRFSRAARTSDIEQIFHDFLPVHDEFLRIRQFHEMQRLRFREPYL